MLCAINVWQACDNSEDLYSRRYQRIMIEILGEVDTLSDRFCETCVLGAWNLQLSKDVSM